MGDEGRRTGGFWRRFGVLFGWGFIGVVALAPAIAPGIRSQLDAMGGGPDVPFGVVLALSLVNPLILLAISVAVGIRLAPRLGLRSLLDDRAATGEPVLPRLRPHLGQALGLGLVGGLGLLVGDLLFQPFIDVDLADAAPLRPGTLAALVGGMLYGGITEELLMRWGLMTFLAWVVWRVVGRGRGAPGATVMWAAILGSAIAFGVGHLPALAAATPLTPMLVFRTVALNALGGILFGWLYWKRSLEVGMVAHASFHVVFFAATLAFG